MPAKNPCVKCSKSVTQAQKALDCGLCGEWCHASCPGTQGTNIPDAIYDAHNSEEKDGSLCWLCPKCRHHKDSIFSAYRDFTAFKAVVDNQLLSFQAQLDQMKSGPPTASTEPAPVAFYIQEEVAEALTREKKKFTVVVVGLTDAVQEDGRQTVDNEAVQNFCTKLNIPGSAVADVFRAGILKSGRPPNRTRVFLRSFINKDKMLSLKGYHGAKQVATSYARHVPRTPS